MQYLHTIGLKELKLRHHDGREYAKIMMVDSLRMRKTFLSNRLREAIEKNI